MTNDSGAIIPDSRNKMLFLRKFLACCQRRFISSQDIIPAVAIVAPSGETS
jgi:hypothetical protein